MYVSPNFKTKKELINAVKNGARVTVFSPWSFPCPKNGVVSVEGPHYPKPHTWYARVEVTDSVVTQVKV